MRKQRDEQQFLNAFRVQFADRIFDGGILIAHRQCDGQPAAALQFSSNMPACRDQRRAFACPNFFIGFGRMLRTRRQNGKIDDAPANRKRRVEHAAIHQEFAQIFAHVWNRRRIRRAKIYE